MEARLPEDKLEKSCSGLTEFLSCKRVSLKELHFLIGLFNFACCVVVPGREFLRHLIDLTKGIQKPHHRVRLTKDTKYNIIFWHDFLHSNNGKSFSPVRDGETSKSLYLRNTGFAKCTSVLYGKVFTSLSTHALHYHAFYLWLQARCRDNAWCHAILSLHRSQSVYGGQ